VATAVVERPFHIPVSREQPDRFTKTSIPRGN
jgi:hypothetical protein